VTLRARLLIAFLALALVPTALLTVFTLDRLGHAIALWNTRGVDRALESALEVSKTSLARMEASALTQSDDWAEVLPEGDLTPASRTALRVGMRAAGLDFMQLYRRDGEGWRLVEEVLPEGVLSPMPLDLAAELPHALTADRLVRSPRGALAAVATTRGGDALVAGMRVPPDFFVAVRRVSEGVGFYRRFGVVRDVSRTYTLLLVALLVLALTAAAVWAATALARSMTRPLRDLGTALERVAGGDLESRITPDGAHELRTLAERFNAMTGSLATARAAVQQAEREAAWREVARRLAHEFKNILTPMSLSLHRLQRRASIVPDDERRAVEESLQALARGVDQLSRLAGQFSQYARLPEPRRERIDLDEVVRAAVGLHEHEGVRVEVTGADGELPVWGDPLLLSRAVHNLILNGCEASPGGSVVQVRLSRSTDQAVVEVLDRGTGLDAAVRERLFEPYVSTKRRGSGLGLSLVRDIAGQHGGTVTLDDREGGGACARLMLPLAGEDGREAMNG
jgi:nitrogen fixation/metabolism regulation signal transduction histidine kinase